MAKYPKNSPTLDDVFDTESQATTEETSSISNSIASLDGFLYLESDHTSQQSYSISLPSKDDFFCTESQLSTGNNSSTSLASTYDFDDTEHQLDN